MSAARILPSVVLLLAACAGEPSQPPAVALSASLRGDAVEARIENLPPAAGESIELIDPQGAVYRPVEITREIRERAYGPARPTVGVGVFGSSSGRTGSSVGISIPVGSGGSTGARTGERQNLVALFLPDPQLYRVRPEAWSIVLRYNDRRGVAQRIAIAAPRP